MIPLTFLKKRKYLFYRSKTEKIIFDSIKKQNFVVGDIDPDKIQVTIQHATLWLKPHHCNIKDAPAKFKTLLWVFK